MSQSLLHQYPIDTLQVDKLLEQWRWLCPASFELVARNAFGDLFLRDKEGKVNWLDVTGGELKNVADGDREFWEAIESGAIPELAELEADARGFDLLGLSPAQDQCIGFKMPLVFAESKDVLDNAYLANLYECVSFLGDLHRQLRSHPDGTKVELVIR